jgi:hypothetical protein
MATAKRSFMKLNEVPEIVTWPETHYAFIEKIGPFQETAPQAWQTMHQLIPTISEHNKITGYMSLYKVEAKMYRRCFARGHAEQFAGGRGIHKFQRWEV